MFEMIHGKFDKYVGNDGNANLMVFPTIVIFWMVWFTAIKKQGDGKSPAYAKVMLQFIYERK